MRFALFLFFALFFFQKSSSKKLLSDEALTKIHLQLKKIADKDNNVIIAESNYGFHDLVENFLFYLSRSSFDSNPTDHLLFFPLDHEMKEALKGKAHTFFSPEIGAFSKDAEKFRAHEYNKIVKQKWFLIQTILTLGYNVFLTDVDVVWLRDPLSLLQEIAVDCDVFFYCAVPADTLFSEDCKKFSANTGVIFFRATRANALMVDMFVDFDYGGVDDQTGLDRFFSNKLSKGIRPSPSPFLSNSSWFNSLPPQVLKVGSPKNRFVQEGNCSSLSFVKIGTFTKNQVSFPLQIPKLDSIENLHGIHFNFLSGLTAKRNEMEMMRLWMNDLGFGKGEERPSEEEVYQKRKRENLREIFQEAQERRREKEAKEKERKKQEAERKNIPPPKKRVIKPKTSIARFKGRFWKTNPT